LKLRVETNFVGYPRLVGNCDDRKNIRLYDALLQHRCSGLIELIYELIFDSLFTTLLDARRVKSKSNQSEFFNMAKIAIAITKST